MDVGQEIAGAVLMREFVPSSPFAALLGIAVEELGEDRAVLSLPDSPELATMGTVAHGGAIATLDVSATCGGRLAAPGFATYELG